MSAPEQKFNSTKGPIVLSFLRPGCPHCDALEPKLKTIGNSKSNKATFIMVNVLNNPDMTEKWEVQGVPQVFIYDKNKKLVKHVIGDDLDSIKSGLKIIDINV
jgi:thiol-disulfide isomerase/thioredoxin